MSINRDEIILPPARLGILGGGQLGRFFVQAAQEMGYRVTVFDPDTQSPAGRIADQHLCADYTDQQALAELARTCVAISTEFENVPATILHDLSQHTRVYPSAESVAIAQDRIAEKTFFRQIGLETAPYTVVRSEADLDVAVHYPCILKTARLGYDGKGQLRVANLAEAHKAWQELGCTPCVLEKNLVLELELSVVLARDRLGNIVCFPPAENLHQKGILAWSSVPARLSSYPTGLAQQVQDMAQVIAESLDYVGVLAVEFFVVNGVAYVNEMAPRPHNSGHYTLDACLTSQFEQQVRALVGLSLGKPQLHIPAVMVNILGDVWQNGDPDWSPVLNQPNTKLHLYGKASPRAGRKMGHYTVLHDDIAQAQAIAENIRKRLLSEVA